ncbi:MAG: hypothetical protein N838_29000 [Thiohalocapsa sp. PB-PSB1]|nr:MAG: hypothetical protein N838_29000 [Thiohalocapsa sp. PB-PSB1]HCS90006.1 hypothetical protein [Chromatiaceae bacterium]
MSPDRDAALLFSPAEWQAAYILSKKRPPKHAPTLNTVIRLIAGIGRILGCKGDGERGTRTLWLRLRRDITDGGAIPPRDVHDLA